MSFRSYIVWFILDFYIFCKYSVKWYCWVCDYSKFYQFSKLGYITLTEFNQTFSCFAFFSVLTFSHFDKQIFSFLIGGVLALFLKIVENLYLPLRTLKYFATNWPDSSSKTNAFLFILCVCVYICLYLYPLCILNTKDNFMSWFPFLLSPRRSLKSLRISYLAVELWYPKLFYNSSL